MKGIIKRLTFSGIILLLVFATVSTNRVVNPIEEPINTEITSLSWVESSATYPSEDYSYFLFTIGYVIYNPNAVEVVLTFPYCNLLFLANITADFEDNSLDIYYFGLVGLCAIADITIQPGYTPSNTTFMLCIQEKGLDDLPNGVYKIWILGYLVSAVTFNVTTLTITDEGTEIDVGTIPSIEIGFQLIAIVIGVTLFFSITTIAKKRYRKESH